MSTQLTEKYPISSFHEEIDIHYSLWADEGYQLVKNYVYEKIEENETPE